MQRESIEFRGRLYNRYPQSKLPHARDYFWGLGRSLHRDVYTACIGPIPARHVIHHRNKSGILRDSPGNLEAKLPREHSLEHFYSLPLIEMRCLHCLVPFASRRNASKFCTNACKSKWRRHSGLDNVAKRCRKCGALFYSNRYDKQLFCSRSCANRGHA